MVPTDVYVLLQIEDATDVLIGTNNDDFARVRDGKSFKSSPMSLVVTVRVAEYTVVCWRK